MYQFRDYVVAADMKDAVPDPPTLQQRSPVEANKVVIEECSTHYSAWGQPDTPIIPV
jgi:hypothetical protein